MSKIMLKCFAVAVALGIFPAGAFAENASQSHVPYNGPLPAGVAMTPKVAAAWYGNGTLVGVGAGVLVVGGVLVALSSHGKSTTSTTSTTSTN